MQLTPASLATNYHVLGKFLTLSAQIIDDSSARISGADLWQLMPAFLATNDYALGKFLKLLAQVRDDSSPHISGTDLWQLTKASLTTTYLALGKFFRLESSMFLAPHVGTGSLGDLCRHL